MELCRKYDDTRDTILLQLGQAEEKLNVMRPIVFKKNELEEQIKEFQISGFRHCSRDEQIDE